MTIEEINIRLAELLSKSDSDIQTRINNFEKNIIDAYSLALKDIKNEIALMYEKYGDNVAYTDMMRYNRLTNLVNQIKEEVKSLANGNISSLTSSLKDFYSESYYRTAFGFESALDVKLGFGLLDADAVATAVLNPVDRINWIKYPDIIRANAQEYTRRIITEITTGLIKGEGYAKMAAHVTEQTSIDANKSLRITRTGAHKVQSAGRLSSMDKAEVAINNRAEVLTVFGYQHLI